MRPGRVGAAAALWIASGAILMSCETAPKNGSASELGTLGDPPPYRELAQQHNDRLSNVVGFYSTADVEVTWIDENGEKQREIGEGNLIFSRPDQVALTFRKLGEVYLWLGGGPERSWMLWGGDVSRAFIARNENIFNDECDEFPIPLLPAELIDLYGVFELNLDAPGTVVADEQRRAWVLTAPGRWCQRRIWYGAEDGRPVRVELFDRASGRVWAASELSEYREMEIRGVAPGNQPFMPTVVEVRAGESQSEGVVRLRLFNPSDVAPNHRRINPAIFDFDAIRGNMRPREVVVLDALSERPALPPSTESP